MAVDFAVAIAVKIGEYLVAPIGRQFGYLFFYNDNIKNLKDEVEKLENMKVMVQQRVDTAKRNVENIAPGVEPWLEKVDEFKAAAGVLKDDEAKVNRGCLNGWCPDLKSRYSLGRKGNKMTKNVVKHQGDGKFVDGVAHPAAPVGIVLASTLTTSPTGGPGPLGSVTDPTGLASTSSSTGSLKGATSKSAPTATSSITSGGDLKGTGFASRQSAMKEVMEAMKGFDNEIDIIGVCGMPGVGKTTMVKAIFERVKSENLFDEVAFAVVSQNRDLIRIQDKIAEMLGLEFTGEKTNVFAREQRLRQRLMNDKRILLILDDVWEHFDLGEVGIPIGGDYKGYCKVILTSRFVDACSGMGSKKIITVQVLSDEEAWLLFREMAGNSVDSTDICPIAKEVANECGGLPLAIVTVGKAMRNKEKKYAWNDALEQLRKPVVRNTGGIQNSVYSSIQLSYDYLKKDESRLLLLLCSLFPEDHEIQTEELVRYGKGLESLKDSDQALEKTRDRILSRVDELKSCHLLLAGKEELVKMHDVIRDFCLSILSENNDSYIINHDDAVSQAQLACILHLEEKPRDCFKGRKEIGVVGFNEVSWGSLPLPSLELLTNLRTLSFHYCSNLENMSLIGNLKKLEILSFYGSGIDELPSEIGQLNNLRLLDLRYCKAGINTIPAGVLASLSKLEELYLDDGFPNWAEEGCNVENASLTELNSLPHLNTLSIYMSKPDLLPAEFRFEKLMRFWIMILPLEKAYGLSHETKVRNNLFRLESFDINMLLGKGIKESFKRTGVLKLNEVRGFKDLVKLDKNGFEKLKTLRMCNCEDVEYLIDAMDSVPSSALTNLESLEILDLPNLIEICHVHLPAESFGRLQEVSLYDLPAMRHLWRGPRVLGNLTVLRMDKCGAIKGLFPYSTVKSLQQLQKLEIYDCEMLEEIVWKEGVEEDNYDNTENIEFPKLDELVLEGLPKLRSFYPGDSKDKHDDTIQPFFNPQVILPTMKELHMEHINNAWGPIVLVGGQIQDGSLCKLRVMTVGYYNTISRLWNAAASDLVKLLQNLETLIVDSCDSLETVFDFEGLKVRSRENAEEEVVTQLADQLKSLKVYYLGSLTHIWRKVPKGIQGFQNLVSLTVIKCPSLRCLLSPSVARMLVKLRDLTVKRCYVLEKIIGTEEEEEEEEEEEGGMEKIFFPELVVLTLIDLENLETVVSGSYNTCRWPTLKRLDVIRCPKLTALHSGSTANAQTVVQQESSITSLVERKHHFNGKVILPSLEELCIGSVGNLELILDGLMQTGSLYNVRRMMVTCASRDGISRLFNVAVASDHLVKLPQNLEEIEVTECDDVMHWKQCMTSRF